MESEGRALHIRIHPDWRTIVHASDQEYVAALLADCKDRAESDPLVLFEHMLSLGVGPVVTYRTGPSLAGHPALADLYAEFVDL